MCVLAVKMRVSKCGVENWSLMVVVLFMKNMAKSSAVRVYHGGGGGKSDLFTADWQLQRPKEKESNVLESQGK